MADRPILFSAAMVRANLDGRKTQTRRILSTRNSYRDGSPWSKHYPPSDHDWNDAFVDPGPSPAGNPGPYLKVAYPPDETRHRVYPLMWPGDRLWVREAHMLADRSKGFDPTHWMTGMTVGYLADGEGEWVDRALAAGCRRRPSIHMPRWASRTTLLVTNVRIERLQDISEGDADAEGFGGNFPDIVMPDVFPSREIGWGHLSIAECYGRLWDHINGPGAWDANPWVVATTYTVHRWNIGAMPAPPESAA